MIKAGKKKIIDIIYYSDSKNTRLYAGKLNNSIIYQPETIINLKYEDYTITQELNVGDTMLYTININAVDYKIKNITNNYGSDLTVKDNTVKFNKEGVYTIYLIYKTYRYIVNVTVYNIGISLF